MGFSSAWLSFLTPLQPLHLSICYSGLGLGILVFSTHNPQSALPPLPASRLFIGGLIGLYCEA